MATVTIQKRKRKKRTSYLVYYKVPTTGEKKYFKSYPQFIIARQVANDLRALLDAGKLPNRKKNKLILLTFDQVSKSLREQWDGMFSRKELSTKTHENYCIWLNVLNRYYGKTPLCQITKDDIKAYTDALATEHTRVTSNKYLSIFKKVFAHGVDINAVIYNPADEIPFLDEKDHERNVFLLPPQLDQLIEAAKKTRAKYYMPAMIYLGAEHGASKQEILSLEIPDIDFDYRDIGLIRLYRTKNKKHRVEYLMPRTKKALQSWLYHLEWKRKKDRVTNIKSDRVFCRIDGTPIKCFNKAWWHALKLSGIKEFHFHDLRHTFCSNIILSGGNLKDAKEMIGHNDISMTDRYSHLTGDHRLRTLNQLAEHYSENGKTGVG